MALSPTEHDDAAAKRAANRQRVSGATVLTATDATGLNYMLVMVIAKEVA